MQKRHRQALQHDDGMRAASRLGLVIGNVKNLILHNVSIDGQDGERLCLSGVENVEEEQD